MAEITMVEKIFKIQNEIGHVAKNGFNPHFQNQYVSLDKLIEICRKKAEKWDILITQQVRTSELGMRVDTLLTDIGTGEIYTFEGITLKSDRMNPQGFGSALTYARRYSLATAFMVVTDSDDDGEKACKPDRDFLIKSLNEGVSLGILDLQKVLKHYNAEKIETMSDDNLENAVSLMNKKAKQKKAGN